MSATSLALSNLRAIVILIVLGFHSIMGYLGSLPSEPPRFDAPPYDWQAFPVFGQDHAQTKQARNNASSFRSSPRPAYARFELRRVPSPPKRA